MKNERCVWTCLKTFFSQKLCFVRSCCLEEGRLPLPVWRINSENKCDVCAQAFWWTKSVSEQIRSVHFEKENYRDTFLRKKVCWKMFRDHMENSDGTFWLSLNNLLYLIELFNFRALLKILIELSDCHSIIDCNWLNYLISENILKILMELSICQSIIDWNWLPFLKQH